MHNSSAISSDIINSLANLLATDRGFLGNSGTKAKQINASKDERQNNILQKMKCSVPSCFQKH